MKALDEATLKKARAWCEREYRTRRPERMHEHPSFLARDILREAETLFDLDTFGVEGFCDQIGKHGVSYLNTGDTYGRTVIFRTRSERFSVGAWGDHPHA